MGEDIFSRLMAGRRDFESLKRAIEKREATEDKVEVKTSIKMFAKLFYDISKGKYVESAEEVLKLIVDMNELRIKIDSAKFQVSNIIVCLPVGSFYGIPIRWEAAVDGYDTNIFSS